MATAAGDFTVASRTTIPERRIHELYCSVLCRGEILLAIFVAR